MADSVAQAVAKFHKAADRMEHATDEGEKTAALFMKQTILAISPDRLRNVGRKGAKLGVGYRPFVGGGTLVHGRGPWQIIEFDTKPHMIGGGRSKKREVRSYLQFATGDIRFGPVTHPGTAGQHPFRKGVELARPAIPKIYQSGVRGALGSVFGL